MASLKKIATTSVAALGMVLSACSAQNAPEKTSAESTTETTSSTAASGSAITIKDVKGRTVSFDSAPQRIILGEGRGMFAAALLNKENPVENLVAVGSDLTGAAPSFRERLLEVTPTLAELPEIGNLAKGDVSVENLLELNPDALVMTADHYDGAEKTGLLAKIEEAGIKYIVTDFRQHPLTNTTVSIEALGALLGQEERAEAFNKEWTKTVERVQDRVKDLKDEEKPTGFVWRGAGRIDCCGTVANANLGEFITAAGGKNSAEAHLDTNFGTITPEQLIADNPDFVFATGGSWKPKEQDPSKANETSPDAPHISLGYLTDPAEAERTLVAISKIPAISQLDALDKGQFYAVWHQFYDNPLNFLALEQFAAWMHPDLFADVDTEAHWKEIHTTFLPFEASGIFFAETSK